MEQSLPIKVLIVGGGFLGIRTALDLAKSNRGEIDITLMSDLPHTEYHAALYRVVAGRSPREVCIPIAEIFEGKKVHLVLDRAVSVETNERVVTGKSGAHYNYDHLVIGLGSETAYMNIPGLDKLSFGFKSIVEALALRQHLHELFTSCENMTREEKVCAANIVVIGGGASGVEIAGELAVYTEQLAKKHNVDPSLVSIELIEYAPRLLPALPPEMGSRAKKRLHELGVNIFLNREVVKEEVEHIYMKGMELKTQTVIWTAGMRPNSLYQRISGLKFDRAGKIIVDEHLRPEGKEHIYVGGDVASTPYAGMAQTAIHDGAHIAQVILADITSKPLPSYKPTRPSYAIPVGYGWAAALVGPIHLYGKMGWIVRRAADLSYFLSILPIRKALLVFQNGKTLCESCAICSVQENMGNHGNKDDHHASKNQAV